MSPGSRVDPGARYGRQVLLERVRAVARPLLIWWVFLVVMFAAFALAVMIDDPGLDSLMALGIFAGITVAGAVSGQVLALLRVRDWILFLMCIVVWTVGSIFGAFATSLTGALGVLVFAVVVLYPLFTVGGAWSLQSGKALFGAWVPLVYATGCAIVIAEDQGRVSTWKEGAKYAIWDVFTISVLGTAILLFVVYLISRETHRLALWRRGPLAPLMGSVEESGAARPRLSLLGWLLVGMLTLVLTVGTAIMAPYLWRTGPGEADDDDDPPVQDDTGSPKPPPEEQPQEGDQGDRANKDIKERWQKAAGDKMQEAREELRPQVGQALDLLSTLLIALVLLLLLLLTFWRPVRRMLLARHFEHPFVDLPPTARVRNGWRLVEIALGDAGMEPLPNEPAHSLLRRASGLLHELSPGGVEVHGLAEAAEIRDRVEYGLGVHPDDVRHMERTARWTYHTVWDRLGEWVKVKRLYRGI